MRKGGASTLATFAAILGSMAALSWHQASKGEEPSPEPASASITPAADMSLAETNGIIFERQNIMLQLDRDTKELGMIVAGTAPASKLAETTRAIAQGARHSVAVFRQAVPGGRSKPEVWTKHSEFMTAMESFASKAEEMAQAGAAGNMGGVMNLMVEALPCKQCHDGYRGPKPS